MTVVSKKICMVGPFAVGKTSLVRRFVESIFSDKYQTTIGVKISKKLLHLESCDLQLMLWDIEGVDVFTELRTSYLRGAQGVMIVVDGTRTVTLSQIDRLQTLVAQHLNDVPVLLLINKADLELEWKLDDSALEEFETRGLRVFKTSAKTGSSVEQAFKQLADEMLESSKGSESTTS